MTGVWVKVTAACCHDHNHQNALLLFKNSCWLILVRVQTVTNVFGAGEGKRCSSQWVHSVWRAEVGSLLLCHPPGSADSQLHLLAFKRSLTRQEEKWIFRKILSCLFVRMWTMSANWILPNRDTCASAITPQSWNSRLHLSLENLKLHLLMTWLFKYHLKLYCYFFTLSRSLIFTIHVVLSACLLLKEPHCIVVLVNKWYIVNEP